MQKIYKTSTAMALALSLAAPSPLMAQGTLEVLQNPETPPEMRPVCGDGTLPVCADGASVLTFGEMSELYAGGGETAAAIAALLEADATAAVAICADGMPAICEAGAQILVPGNENYEAAADAARMDASDQPAEAAEAVEGAAPADAEAVVDNPDEAIADTEADAAADATIVTEGTIETEGTMETDTEAAAEAEVLPEADPTAEAEAVVEAEPEPEPAPEAEATAEAAATEGETDPDELAAALAEQSGDAGAEEPAEVTAEATDEAPAEQPAEEMAAAEAETSTEAMAETDGALVVEGDEEMIQQAEQAAAAIGAATEDAAAGEPEMQAAAAAAVEGEAEVTETTETTLTEADTRQSSEDFATTAAGEANASAAVAAEEDDGLSTFEKAALAGLGILAVGAILNNGDRVVANTGDRVVVQRGDNNYYVLKDDDSLLRQPGANVRTETFADGSTRTTVTRENGSKIITIRDASGRVLRRVSEAPDGTRYVLIDDLETYEAVEVETLPEPESRIVVIEESDPEAIRVALERASAQNVNRAFSLRQIRQIERVRKLVPEIALDEINFETASAAIRPTEAEELARLGDLLTALIDDNPGEVFLIEGHTDTVGSSSYNLALSDRRAESVALALTEYFDVPPENMVVQGYGESDLKVASEGDIRENRRVSIRRITPLLIDRVARN